MEFVRHYHSLTHLPIPVLEELQLGPFLEKIVNLIEPECKKNEVTLTLEVREPVLSSLDPKLIEQVLLNLIRNSIQALDSMPAGKSITVFAGSDVTGVQISVKSDLGKGAGFILRF